ncbi:endoplasmic oxidoreductin [Ascobolus immersus RN42]|uniref:Endoplasmic oxidoreductin n=1 Tax=Ascobolus immersus RN42 TaxID=1160509 RepID=A0A3N4ICV5_ASCIM|nr:endoplasmic oxidoreductin [Ascobolus immersus RN42]
MRYSASSTLTPIIATIACAAAASTTKGTSENANLDKVKSTGFQHNSTACVFGYTGRISDACATYSTIDEINSYLAPTLNDLTEKLDYFAYYRLNLYDKECPFWEDNDALCGNRACAVETIDDEDSIPSAWRASALGTLQGPRAVHPSEGHFTISDPSPLDGQLGSDTDESCVMEYDTEGCDEHEYCIPEDESSGEYVSLVANPESFTGYTGPSAHHVWSAIYDENCFPSTSAKGEVSANACLEKRVFQKIISGMHASISAHICYHYLDQQSGIWAPNLSCFLSRFSGHPERIQNIYFNYALLLRAVSKLAPHLKTYSFCEADPTQDGVTKSRILDFARKAGRHAKVFDETLMFQPSQLGIELKEEFKHKFRNISRIMDCVGCDRCRLWGKIQTQGYGTALKVLFEFDDEDSEPEIVLRRTELVALFNTLARLSDSLQAVKEFAAMAQGSDWDKEDPGTMQTVIADTTEEEKDNSVEYVEWEILAGNGESEAESVQDLDNESMLLPGDFWETEN